MRPAKVIKIGEREITIKEITVREIRTFWQDLETEPQAGVDGMYAVLTRFFPTCVSGVALSELDDMTPSEIKQIYTAFREINADFFEAAKMIEGENPILVGLREIIQPLLIARFAGFFPTAIPEPGDMDSPSSSQPSEP